MSKKVAVTNTNAMPIYVGAQMIPAGETRHFDVDQVPEHLRPAPEEAEPVAEPIDPMQALSEGKVSDITAALPALSDADLEHLGELEQTKGDAARKTLLAAIADETIKRAEAIGG